MIGAKALDALVASPVAIEFSDGTRASGILSKDCTANPNRPRPGWWRIYTGMSGDCVCFTAACVRRCICLRNGYVAYGPGKARD